MLERQKKWIRAHIKEVVSIKKDPKSIAWGFALGVFIGILPTLGMNIVIGFLIIFFFKKVNKISLFAGLLLINPLTQIPIYIASFSLGDLLLGNSTNVNFKIEFFNTAYNFTRRFLVGNLIIAAASAGVGYISIYHISKGIQARRRKRLLEKKKREKKKN